jgi:hypothetical protein
LILVLGPLILILRRAAALIALTALLVTMMPARALIWRRLILVLRRSGTRPPKRDKSG